MNVQSVVTMNRGEYYHSGQYWRVRPPHEDYYCKSERLDFGKGDL